MATVQEDEAIGEEIQQAKSAAKPSASDDELVRQRLLIKKEDLEVDKYFRALVKLEGSDLHMKVGRPPMIRTRNELRPLNRPPIDTEEMMDLLVPMMNERNKKIFYEEGGADFAYTVDVDGVTWRFRVNLLQQMGKIGMVARRVNNKIPDLRGSTCRRRSKGCAFMTRGWCCWRASPARARARRSPRCSTTST